MATNDDVELLQQLIGYGGQQAFSLVPMALKKVILEQQWENRKDKDGNPFRNFEAFVTHRLWQGLESTIDDLRVFCRKHPDVQRLILEAMEPEREHGINRYSRVDNVKSKTQGGNSALYTLKRLKRDHPDLFQQVLGGVMSANAAAKKAGFRKQMAAIDHATKLVSKLSDDEWLHLKQAEDRRRGFT